MARPVVGIIGNHFLINDQYPAHAGGMMNSEAIAQVSACLPSSSIGWGNAASSCTAGHSVPWHAALEQKESFE